MKKGMTKSDCEIEKLLCFTINLLTEKYSNLVTKSKYFREHYIIQKNMIRKCNVCFILSVIIIIEMQ